MSTGEVGGVDPNRPTMTAATAAVAAVLGTLAVAVAVDGTVPGLAGLLAGACLATAVVATAEADYGVAIPVTGVLGALGGIAGIAGPLAVAVVRVPWPPIPPIPYLPFAPFAAFGAAVLVGFGAATVAAGSPPSADAGAAGSRMLAVACVPAVAVLVVAPAPPADVVALAVVLGVVAFVTSRWTATGDEEIRLGPSTVVHVAVGLALSVAVWPFHASLGRLAIEASATETGRRTLEAWLAALGTDGAALAVLTAALAASGLFLLGVRVADRVRLLGGAAGVQFASLGVLVAAGGAAVHGSGPVAVFATVALSLLVWDLGEYAATLGREVGRGGDTRRGELVHAVGALAVAGVSVLAATGVAWLGGVVGPVSAPAAPSLLAMAAATVGTLLCFLSLR